MKIVIEIETLASDPDLEIGGILTLERADGRSVWRQRLEVADVYKSDWQIDYVMKPIE